MHRSLASLAIPIAAAALCALAGASAPPARDGSQLITRPEAEAALRRTAELALELVRAQQRESSNAQDRNADEDLRAALNELSVFYHEWLKSEPDAEPPEFAARLGPRDFTWLLEDNPDDRLQQHLGDEGRAWLSRQRCEYLERLEASRITDAIDAALACRYHHADLETVIDSMTSQAAVHLTGGFSDSAFIWSAQHALLRAIAAGDADTAAAWTKRWIDLYAILATRSALDEIASAGRISALSAILHRAMVSYDIEPAVLSAIAHAMETARPLPEAAFAVELRRLGDECFIHDSIVDAYDDAKLMQPPPQETVPLLVPTRAELAEALGEFRIALEMRTLLLQSRGHSRPHAEAMRAALLTSLQQMPAHTKPPLNLARMQAISAISHNRIITHGMAARTRLAGTRLMVAIEWMRADTGNLPASLDDLIPKYARSATGCNFAADGRFRYRLLDPDSTQPGSGYLLYSVAPDGLDNAGHTGDAVNDHIPTMSLHDTTGLDWLINKAEPLIFLPQDAAACIDAR